jgi:CheY-like chemotaxis protein
MKISAATGTSKKAETRPSARGGFTRGRVLVVDDDPAILRLIEEGLAHAGFEVVPAGDGIDALFTMYARRPDVILVDLAMPRMGGIELITHVCTDTSFRDVAVVAMSGHEGMLRRATEAGASAGIVKPVSIQGIIRALRRHKRRSADNTP